MSFPGLQVYSVYHSQVYKCIKFIIPRSTNIFNISFPGLKKLNLSFPIPDPSGKSRQNIDIKKYFSNLHLCLTISNHFNPLIFANTPFNGFRNHRIYRNPFWVRKSFLSARKSRNILIKLTISGVSF